jgi:hypothetical protein
VSETYAPVLLKWKARRCAFVLRFTVISADDGARLRKSTGKPDYYAPLELNDTSIVNAILISCYKPFRTWAVPFLPVLILNRAHSLELMFFDRMALLLDIWTALLLGILYLSFQAFPIIFEVNHGFNVQSTGMSFLGIGVGMIAAISTQPFWNRLVLRHYVAIMFWV